MLWSVSNYGDNATSMAVYYMNKLNLLLHKT